MRHLLSTIFILISLLNSSVVKSDVTEYFNYNLGDSYKSVMTTINRTDPYKCSEKKKNLSSYRYPISYQKGPMFYPDEQVGIYLSLENQKVMTVTNQVTDKNCDIETVEFLNFCLSNGELVLYQVRYPIDRERFGTSNPVFDRESEMFIGFTENDELGDYEFRGQFVSFTVMDKKSGVIRQSYMTLLGTPLVSHTIFKSPNNTLSFGKSKLCPEGSDVISDFQPKYTSLEKVMWTSKEVISRFEQRRQYYNKCVVLFPEHKKEYDQFWNNFRKLNEDDFNLIKNKVDQILISSDNKILSEQFKSDTEGSIKFLTGMVDNLTTDGDSNRQYSLEHCNQMVGGIPKKIGQTRSKMKFDPEYIKSIELN